MSLGGEELDEKFAELKEKYRVHQGISRLPGGSAVAPVREGAAAPLAADDEQGTEGESKVTKLEKKFLETLTVMHGYRKAGFREKRRARRALAGVFRSSRETFLSRRAICCSSSSGAGSASGATKRKGGGGRGQKQGRGLTPPCRK